MAHIPITESYVEKVIRIQKVLDISIEEAAVTCDAFHLAFSGDRMRRAIFGMIDELDRSAAKKGEPLGLIINYTVELGMEGFRVARYADEIPAGELVELVPPHRAAIHLRIVDNFPTQEFLGPLIVNRPGWHFDTFNPDAPDLEITEEFSGIQPTRPVICLGPIRLKFNERFPVVAERLSKSHRTSGSRTHRAGAVSSLSSGGSPVTSHLLPVTCNLSPGASHLGHFGSGLSPPPYSETWDTPIERCPEGPWHISVETYVSHLDL